MENDVRPLKSGVRLGILSPSCSSVLYGKHLLLNKKTREAKDRIRIGKEEVKLSLFADYMISHMRSKTHTRKLVEMIKK